MHAQGDGQQHVDLHTPVYCSATAENQTPRPMADAPPAPSGMYAQLLRDSLEALDGHATARPLCTSVQGCGKHLADETPRQGTRENEGCSDQGSLLELTGRLMQMRQHLMRLQGKLRGPLG